MTLTSLNFRIGNQNIKMGRSSTGAYTISNALSLKLGFLIKEGFFVKEKEVYGDLSWSNQFGKIVAKISLHSNFPSEGKPYMRLSYNVSDPLNGQKVHLDEIIYLEVLPSNLGKGKVLYFICPTNGTRCRILYRAYGSSIWQSSKAYHKRIYYPTQLSSLLEYNNDKYSSLERKLIEVRGKRFTHYYKGKQTKRAIRCSVLLKQLVSLAKTRSKKEKHSI